MKKVMCLLALAGLIVGCAHERNVGGTSDQTEISNGADYSSTPTPNIINTGDSP
jgi:hypothetical protein